MRRRPPRSTRTDTLLPYTTRCRSQVHARVMREVIEPTVRGMAADGVPFSGFLYAGLMIDAQGTPRVIEFNVRFGDPETQPILMRLQSDLLELIDRKSVVEGKSVSVRVDLGGRRVVKKKKEQENRM